MDYPVEFTAVTADSFVESKYFDKIYDTIVGKPKQTPAAISETQRSRGAPQDPAPGQKPPPPASSYRSQRPGTPQSDLDDESLQSERVLRAYEAERDDPKRKPSASLVGRSVSLRQPQNRRRDSGRMSNANGGYGRSERPSSQRGGGTKYDDYYDDDYESDYDDRTGRRTRTTGRGYDAERDRSFDREIVETERYRGPARDYDPRRNTSFNDPYQSAPYQPYPAPGQNNQMQPYRRSQGDLVAAQSARSGSRRDKSRGRRDSYSRSRSRSRSRQRSRSHSGIRGKIDEHFDTSLQGLGVGVAGALIGGFAGREFGSKRTSKRDMAIGAVVGGLGANLAEHKWRDWRDEKRERREDERYDDRYDDRRARSAMR